MYRYLREHRPRIYPNIAYTSLGLRHEHLLITNPGLEWEQLPYTIESDWAASTPGERTLYLHCLVPTEVHETFREELGKLSCTSYQRITTGDAWQHLAPLADAIDEQGRPTGNYQHDTKPPPCPLTTLAQEHRLLVPIATALHEGKSAHDTWSTIYARLGERVWDRLPRHTRRWRHNGKMYVTKALKILHEYGLIRQHIIKYDALHQHLQEVLLVMQPGALDAVRSVAPVIEIYEAEDVIVARAFGGIPLIKTIYRHEAVRACWLIDERTRPPSGFRYDLVERA